MQLIFDVTNNKNKPVIEEMSYKETTTSYFITKTTNATNNLNNVHIESITVNEKDMYNIYKTKFLNIYSPIIRKTLKALLDKLYFLGFQLNYEYGNIEEDYFNNSIKEFIKKKNECDPKEILKDILLLEEIIGKDNILDFDIISEIFQCKIKNVKKAFEIKAGKEISSEQNNR